MAILQAGVPKSGNYWLYKIIASVLHQAGREPKSFIQHHQIQATAQTWRLSFDGQATMDFLTIADRYCSCELALFFKRKLLILMIISVSVVRFGHILQSIP
ncbi:MAG: hypothetical protein HC825_09430 [Oscillatoriales cyanobacterium RM1_1_9]|nr:hypothetical protein [Oscillatoriales cyanobacterium RM1_1_9]